MDVSLFKGDLKDKYKNEGDLEVEDKFKVVGGIEGKGDLIIKCEFNIMGDPNVTQSDLKDKSKGASDLTKKLESHFIKSPIL